MAHTNRLIAGVDLRSQENNREHRTEEIDRKRLIVRRGQAFSLTVHLSDPLQSGHELALVLKQDKNNDDIVIRQRTAGGSGDKWWLHQQSARNELLLTVYSPARAAVGEYRLAVELMSGNKLLERTDFTKMYLLFNPWCKDDAVYLPDESLLKEYIMNENGRIFTGSADWMSGLPWNFGQFEDNVMDICFEILDRFKPARSDPPNDMRQRWDPVYISRAVVAMVGDLHPLPLLVNFMFLVGKWQEPYTGGVQPTKWMSSGAHPGEVEQSKSGVKYGQCWCLLVLRCLGIPTRCITNFESAHDTDGNLSIDRVYNTHRQSVNHADSIWNFHCWIESYMQREDLPEGYGGWQVLDPTPQERSSGMFRCGPCPLKAIKEGDLNVKFDVPFVFAEVNADIINWEIRPDGQRKRLSSNSAKVGRNISTKSPYSNEREDITLQYKYQEGSAKEAGGCTTRQGGRISGPDGEEESNPRSNEPGNVQLEIRYAKPVFGTDFDVIFELENMGDEEVSCKLNMMSKACQNSTVNVVIPAPQRETVRLLYTKYASVRQRLSGQEKSILEMVNIPLSKPKLSIKVPGWVILNRKITTVITFTNPLPVPLNRGVFTVEGAGLLPTKEILVASLQGQRVSVELSFTPMRAGVREFLVDFDSDRLQDVKGVATLVVRKTSPSYSSMMPNIFG
uniref:Transglutaminase 2, like n=1 Tax=Gadus morhua TaxID=8049 RepID=A0A8C5FPI3_GADMO